MSLEGFLVASSASSSPMRGRGQSGQEAQRVRGRGRPLREEQVVKDGPLALAVLVGRHDGRWSTELAGQGAWCRALASLVSDRVRGSQPNSVLSGEVLGLAVVRQWRCVLSAASTQDMLALMRASGDTHRRRLGHRRGSCLTAAAVRCDSLECRELASATFRPASSC